MAFGFGYVQRRLTVAILGVGRGAMGPEQLHHLAAAHLGSEMQGGSTSQRLKKGLEHSLSPANIIEIQAPHHHPSLSPPLRGEPTAAPPPRCAPP